jgi:hypothetical protein
MVISLREWGGNRAFPLRMPQRTALSETADVASTTALQLRRTDLVTSSDGIEIIHEASTWRIRDGFGFANLKQDGRPTREANLTSGTEVTIAGRTFIAESPQSIALRSFCFRLLGWSTDRIAVVDHALRAIRLAAACRAPLILTGSGDLMRVAHAIHRYSLGDRAPFVVSDPRRRNIRATVRSAENCKSSLEGLKKAQGGTLCLQARRTPQDFEGMLTAFRRPENSAQLMIYSELASLPNAAQIDIPSLDSRRSELLRIVREYVEDAARTLQVPDNYLDSSEIQWIADHSTLEGKATHCEIEKAALRITAIKVSQSLGEAAALLGMAPVSLERWHARRLYKMRKLSELESCLHEDEDEDE